MTLTHAHRPRGRAMAAIALTVALAVALVACSPGGGTAASAVVPATPILSTAVDLDALVSDATLDGQTVTTRGTFLATGDTAQLCALMLESYPPQCGGASVRIVGEVPADVLAAMDSTRDQPDLAQATWGFVDVTGTYRANGAGGGPTIELGTIALVPAAG
jgi:hypothetical protein